MGRGCIEHIFILRTVAERARDFCISHCISDLRKVPLSESLTSRDQRSSKSIYEKVSEEFNINTSVREEVGIHDLEYAGDMILVSDSMQVLKEFLRALHTTRSGMGLSAASSNKSKILAEYLGCIISHLCSRPNN